MNLETKVCVIVGCITDSRLDVETKAELIEFMWKIEEEIGEQE